MQNNAPPLLVPRLFILHRVEVIPLLRNAIRSKAPFVPSPRLLVFPPEYRLSFRFSSGASRIANHPVQLTVLHDRLNPRFPARTGSAVGRLLSKKKRKEEKRRRKEKSAQQSVTKLRDTVREESVVEMVDRVITREQRGLRAARWELRGKHFIIEREGGKERRFEREFLLFNALKRKRMLLLMNLEKSKFEELKS